MNDNTENDITESATHDTSDAAIEAVPGASSTATQLGSATPQISSPEPDGDHQLLVGMRADLLAPLEAISGYSQMLAEISADRPPEFLSDVEKLHRATREMYEFVKVNLDPMQSSRHPGELPEQLRIIRHDIGNRLNQVLGYCQLLMFDEQEHYFGAALDDLERIQFYCKQCESTLLQYRESSSDRSAGSDPLSASEQKPAGSGTTALRPEEMPDQDPVWHSELTGPAAILVADDNAPSRDMLSEILRRDGHQVSVAADGLEALTMIEHRDFDLVLLDFLMPGMNGFEVLQRLKRDDRLRNTPVIMVSALDSVCDITPCIAIGADDFLTKPVDLTLLKARVNASLEKKRLRERELGQFFTPELARHIVRHPDLLMKGRDVEVTILFCDVRGFSRISERLGPSETVEWLSDVMDLLSDCVIEQQGVLVDYIGDELMAMWGAPDDSPNHAELACRAAVQMLARLPELSDRWEQRVHHSTAVGIGLNTGVARVGNTGSRRKFKYGPLGNSVNLASRVQGATKYLKTNLLVTGSTQKQFGADVTARRLCKVRVVNIDEPVDLYEVLADDEDSLRLKQRYEEALGYFEAQDFRRAAAVLGNLLVDCPQDGPSLMLMSRVVNMLLNQPAEFDCVWELPGK